MPSTPRSLLKVLLVAALLSFAFVAAVSPLPAIAGGSPVRAPDGQITRPQGRPQDRRPLTPPAGRFGSDLPDVTVSDLAGKTVSLRTFVGKPLVINIWATWCSPCMAELPLLIELYDRWMPKGVEVIALSIDEHREDPNMVRGDFKLPFVVLHDATQRFGEAMRAGVVPATFIYDRAGTLIWRYDGVINPDDPQLLQALSQAVSPRPRSPH